MAVSSALMALLQAAALPQTLKRPLPDIGPILDPQGRLLGGVDALPSAPAPQMAPAATDFTAPASSGGAASTVSPVAALIASRNGKGGAPADIAPPDYRSYQHPTRDLILALLGGAAGRVGNYLQQRDLIRYEQDALNAQHQQRGAQADAMGLKGRERTLFLTSPEEWSKAASSRYTVQNVGKDAHLEMAGENDTTPVWDGQRWVSRTPEGQISYTDSRPANYGEQTEAYKAETERRKPIVASPGSDVLSPTGDLIHHTPGEPKGFSVTDNVFTDAGASGSGAAGGLTGDPAAAISQLLGGDIRVTSARRTPEHNASVGGAPNSFHLSGHALDFIPPPGMSMAQAAALLKNSGMPFAELLDEGDHVHVAWREAQSGAPGGYKLTHPGQPDDTSLTPESVDLLAGKFLRTGVMPPMGMGDKRSRQAVYNRAAEIAKTMGLSPDDIVAGNVSVKAAGAALGKMTQLRSQVEASEQAVLKNMQYAMGLAPKGGGPTGVPVLNRWIQAGRKSIAGDPDVAAFQNAIGTVADEYAKVMTSSTGTGGVTSDSARQEAYRRLNSAASPQQFGAVFRAMQAEMGNRTASLRDAEVGLRNSVRSGRLGGDPSDDSASAADARPGGRADPLGLR